MMVDSDDYNIVKALISELERGLSYCYESISTPETIKDSATMVYLAGQIMVIKKTLSFIREQQETQKED